MRSLTCHRLFYVLTTALFTLQCTSPSASDTSPQASGGPDTATADVVADALSQVDTVADGLADVAQGVDGGDTLDGSDVAQLDAVDSASTEDAATSDGASDAADGGSLDAADDVQADSGTPAADVSDADVSDADVTDSASTDAAPSDVTTPDAAADAASDGGSADAGSSTAALNFKLGNADWPNALLLPILAKSTATQGGLPGVTGGLIEDLDGDGDVDMVVWSETGDAWIYQSVGGGQPAKLSQLKLTTNSQRVLAAAAVPLPSGAVELVFVGSKLWRCRFEGGTWVLKESFGVDTGGDYTKRYTVTLADVDEDGLLDLLVPRKYCAGSVMPEVWVARGDGTYVDRASAWKLGVVGGHWQALASDLDLDGDRDLIWFQHACAKGGTQVYLRADGRNAAGEPVFKRVQPHPLFKFPKPEFLFSSPNGALAGDLNNDGSLDLMITNQGVAYTEAELKTKLPPSELTKLYLSRNMLLLTTASTLKDVSELWGLWKIKDAKKGVDMVAWGLGLADFDLDGDLDVIFNHGENYDAWVNKDKRGPHRPVILGNSGNGFTEVVAGLPKQRSGRAVSVGDIDSDGDVDILLGAMGGEPQLWLNQSSGTWLSVRLQGRLSNRLGLGARVRVTAGSTSQLREISAAGGFGGQSQLAAHFGLPKGTKQVTVEVLWPSGWKQTVAAAAVNQTLVLKESVSLALSARTLTKSQTAKIKVETGASSSQVQLTWVPPSALSWDKPLACSQGQCEGVLKWGQSAKPGMVGRLKLSINGELSKVWPAVTLK